MVKIYLIFFLLFTFSLSVQSDDKVIFSRFFKLIPEDQAFRSLGIPFFRELKTSSLKALVWNVKKAEMANWKKEFLKFSSQQDLFILQEAYGTSVFNETLKALDSFRWNFGVSFLVPKDNDAPTGTIVGSSAEPSLSLVKHSPDVEPIVSTPKSMTLAKYPLKDRSDELLILSVHAINFQTTGAFKRQMDQIAEYVKEHKGPVILAGDFNTWNQSRTSYLFRLAKKMGLQEVNYKNGDLRLKFGNYFLDHTFTRGVQVKNSNVVKTDGSDHSPLFFEFDLI
jgi:endonuclease/exonuclease/phosphatase (EEP) superfamily protein YafD